MDQTSPRVQTILSQGGDLAFSYYEYKYLVRHERLGQVLDLLEEFYGGSDPFAKGIVDSIYYDTPSEMMLAQCLDGEEQKYKFRIRGYGDGTYQQIHQKIKFMSGVAKYKAKIVAQTAINEVAPAWDSLTPLDPQDPSFNHIMLSTHRTGLLLPSIRVKYLRYRFRSYDYRMTMDTNVEVFAPANGLPRKINYAQLPYHVLEIKTRALRPNLPFVGLVKLQQVSFSKFMLGLGLLNG